MIELYKIRKAIKKHYYTSVTHIIVYFILSLFLLCLWEFLGLPWYELTREFVENLSNIIMATTATLVAFIAVFYVFRFRVLTENKRSCGLRKRIFKEKINECKKIKEKVSEDTSEDEWKKIKEEFIKYEGEEKYEKIFEECKRRDFYWLKKNYEKIFKEANNLGRIFFRSIIYAFSIINMNYYYLNTGKKM